MHAFKQTATASLRDVTGEALARVVMHDTKLAVRLIADCSLADELVGKLMQYPGALERLVRSDDAPRWLKSMASDSLDEAGFVILT